jgi:HK97 family phage prohead protease
MLIKINQKIWDEAKQAFKDAYKREPKSDEDMKIVTTTYKKLGGDVSKKSNTFTYNCEFTPSEIISKGDKKYIVEGYVSTIDEDLSEESVTMSAQRDIYDQIMQRVNSATVTGDQEHEIYMSEDEVFIDSIPKIKFIDARITDKGVWVKAEINQHHPDFKSVWGSVKDGFLNAFSITFIPLEAIKKKVGDRWKSFVNRLNLLNITLTGNPMNPNATFQPVMKNALNGLKDSFETHDTNNGDKMTDVEKKTQEQEVASPETTTETVEKVDEVKSEDKVEEKPTEAEEKVEDAPAVETKTNNTEISELKKELSDVKAQLKALREQPIFKAKVETPKLDKKTTQEIKEFNAFNYIK